jgi:hypothetical protein
MGGEEGAHAREATMDEPYTQTHDDPHLDDLRRRCRRRWREIVEEWGSVNRAYLHADTAVTEDYERAVREYREAREEAGI